MKFLFKTQCCSFHILSEGLNLFHRFNDEELHFFLVYLMKLVIRWDNLIELVFHKSYVYLLLYFITYVIKYVDIVL